MITKPARISLRSQAVLNHLVGIQVWDIYSYVEESQYQAPEAGALQCPYVTRGFGSTFCCRIKACVTFL